MIKNIKEGVPFSKCLIRYPQYFPSLYVNIIRTGEATGNLKDSLSQLLNYLQRLDDLRLRVKQAMAYPIFMVLVGLGTIFVMLTFILPRIAGMFDDFQAQLPLPTRMLLGVSDFFKAYWILVIVFLAAVIFLLSRHKPGKESILSRLKYRLPIIKGLIYKQSVSNFSTSLSILLKSGVTLLAALNDAASVIGNPVYIKQLAEVRKDISEGVSFSRSLLKFKIFPSFFVQMVKVGEEGGRLDIILADIASLYEKEIESDLKVISSLIEPAIILVLGLIIGGMLIAMLLPIFNINLLVGG
ncbi:MAG: putative type II secretion system protein F [Candidatus Omnitrophica bacterium ADurb.Bin205]|nr:MAG: putative type II secretion system protein F [Candidatus Omnitrophica bacterium ADurb.Bin205]